MIKYLIISSFLFLISCGKSIEEKDDVVKEELPPDGIYSALLTPVNFRISNKVYGEVKIIKFSDDFKVAIKLNSAPRGRLRQHLLTGSLCPRIEMDENGDAYIDAYEARKSSGSIIVPFDGDLSSQERGYDFLLQGGNYIYARSTSYHLMLSDLHQRDEVINDALVKLSEPDLRFERKVVMVYMIVSDLPSSVSGSEIPIACGVLTRISNRTESEEDEWDNDHPPPERPRRRRPRPSPEPAPDPEPAPGPDIGPDTQNRGWWSRWRTRWERWRDRVEDWWNGENNDAEPT